MPIVTRSQIELAIVDSLRRLGCPASAVQAGQRLEDDLGIDSIEVVELAAAAWKSCGLPPCSLEVREVETVADLADRLEGALRCMSGRQGFESAAPAEARS